MKKTFWLFLAVLVAGTLDASAVIGPNLTRMLSRTRADQPVSINIVLADQVNTARLEARCQGLKKEARLALVVDELKAFAGRSQSRLLSELRSCEARGEVSGIEPFWVVNAVHCRATPQVVSLLAGRADVASIEYSVIGSSNVLAITPETREQMLYGGASFFLDTLREWSVRRVGADSVWRSGYKGDSIIVGNIDTGLNYDHVDVSDHLWTDANYPNHGWNFEQDNNDPKDVIGHGTFTSGIIAADGTSGDSLGVAPSARIMSLRVRTQYDSLSEEQIFAALEFCLAPPLSPRNHAHLVHLGIGWMEDWQPRIVSWRYALTNVATAGLPVICAAGNERTKTPPNSIRTPANCPGPWHHPYEADSGLSGAITVGATNKKDTIAAFSSRGPVTWGNTAPWYDHPFPPGLEKPDFTAPGDNIASIDYRSTNGYRTGWSGSSLASASAAGIAALMLDKNYEVLPWQIDSAFQMTALPRGRMPKNNDYGTGRVTAQGAVRAIPGWVPRWDPGVVGIEAVSDTVDTNDFVSPRAVVYNWGNQPDTFPVHLRIGDTYRDTAIAIVGVKESTTVTFRPQTGFPRGMLAFVCSTAAVRDTLPGGNPNAYSVTKFVSVHDAASLSISNPTVGESIEQYVKIPPTVVVTNYGNVTLDSVRVCVCMSAFRDLRDTLWKFDSVITGVQVGAQQLCQFREMPLNWLDTMYLKFGVHSQQEYHHGEPNTGNPINDTISTWFRVKVRVGIAEGGSIIGTRKKVLPFAVRAPFKPGIEFKDMVIYDAMGRVNRDVLSTGVYYAVSKERKAKRKLIVFN